MIPAQLRPAAQLFVCTHARAENDPLRSGCGRAGPGLYNALKRQVAATGHTADIWVTQARCLGHCPPEGCSVVLDPGNEQWTHATVDDAAELVDRAVRAITKRDG